MGKTEELYKKVRSQLDNLGYLQPVSVHSLFLVEKLLDDLEHVTTKFHHYKILAEESTQTVSELQLGIEPYRQSNAQLVQENNKLHEQLLQEREEADDRKRDLKKQIRVLENEKQHREFLCSQHFARIGDLQQELIEKTVALSHVKGTAKSTKTSVTNNKRILKLAGRSTAVHSTDTDRLSNETTALQHTLDHLTEKINRLNEEKLEFNDAITSYKNKVDGRDKEILRLTQLLEGGRPIMAVNKDCCCCPNQAIDYRLLAKTHMLEDQLEECQEMRHEAMRRAVNLARRNQKLENDIHGREEEEKGCCCTESSKKLCKLQEKLDCRQIQIDQLEHDVEDLQKKNQGLLKDRTDLKTMLEQAIEEKKKFSERINQLNIIEHDLMLEIEKLKRSNSLQKSQLAEMEVKVAAIKEPAKNQGRPIARFRHPQARTNLVREKEKQDSKKVIPAKTTVSTKYPTKPIISKKPQPNKILVKPTPQQSETTGTSQSPRSTSPSQEVTRSPSPTWKEQLLKERKQLEAQIEEMSKKHAEHCAKYHPPGCKNSSAVESVGAGESQWLLLEKVQAERDYYHKEFSRLRDQLCSVPDHSAEITDIQSPNRKLEKLLTERDYYHKEVCRLREDVTKATVDKSEIDELQKKLIIKEDEIMEILNKLQELERRQDSQDIQYIKKQLDERRKEILQKDKKIQDLEKNQLSSNFLETNAELWRKLNLKEEEILMMREKFRELELQGSNSRRIDELQRKLNAREEELLALNKKLEFAEQSYRDIEYKSYVQVREFSSKLDDKSKETSKMVRRIQELERDHQPISCNHQAIITPLEIERDNARGDVSRLQDERNALRNKLQMLTEDHLMEHSRMEHLNSDLESRLCRLEMERNDLINRESNLQSELKIYKEQIQEYKDKVRNLNSDLSHQRSSFNHIKLLQEQTDRALSASQDILTQTEGELASALHRLQELEQVKCCLQREIADMKNERSIFKSNLMQIDQEKDNLLLKVDEKTELNVGLEREIQSRECRIAHLEDIVADLKKKLDLALDGSAHSEQNMRQSLQEATRLRQQVDKLEQNRENALRENRRLQNDLAAMTSDCQIANRNLEATRREVEDLKLQLQGYVTEVRRVEEILQQKESERTDMLEQFRSLTLEATVLESNNHSLESEAKSTKSCLRETQEKVQCLEGKLLEKDSLIHGYETQIGELTHHIAKMERQVSSLMEKKQKGEKEVTAARDLSNNLECQRQCLAQQLAQLQADNKRLEHDVHHLQSEVCELREMLGHERRNSATLENVLAASRQETLQRNMDNNDLKTQVQCLQSKLCELQDKLEHGTTALRHCQVEASDYQTQVAELRREITNERFERVRAEEERRKCICPKKTQCNCGPIVPKDPVCKPCTAFSVERPTGCTCRSFPPAPPVPSKSTFPTDTFIKNKPSRLVPEKLKRSNREKSKNNYSSSTPESVPAPSSNCIEDLSEILEDYANFKENLHTNSTHNKTTLNLGIKSSSSVDESLFINSVTKKHSSINSKTQSLDTPKVGQNFGILKQVEIKGQVGASVITEGQTLSNENPDTTSLTKKFEVCLLDPVPLGLMLSNNSSYAIKFLILLLLAGLGLSRSHSACRA